MTKELAVEKGRLAEMQQLEIISKAIADKDVRKQEAEVSEAIKTSMSPSTSLMTGFRENRSTIDPLLGGL